MTRDRRALDANAALNLAVVRGVIVVSVLATVGDFALAALGKEPPAWTGQFVGMAVGGLIGFLAREMKQHALPEPPAQKEDPV